MHLQHKAGNGYVKIGTRLYERVSKAGVRSYFADVERDGRQSRVKLDAAGRSEARKAQAAQTTKAVSGEFASPSKRTFRDVTEEYLRSFGGRQGRGQSAPWRATGSASTALWPPSETCPFSASLT